MTTDTASAASAALANIAANKGDHVPGFVPNPAATAADFEVGQIVSIFSRGYYRTGVIEKIGRKNVTVLYTTEGAVTEAERLRDKYLSLDVDAMVAKEEASQRRNWAFHADLLLGARVKDHAARFPGQYDAERIASEEAARAEFLAENPDADAWVAPRVARYRADIEARTEYLRTAPLVERVNYTNKSEAFGKVGVRG